MGGWRLETARFAFYVGFPVALFYYFNEPKVYDYFVSDIFVLNFSMLEWEFICTG
jgi:hypothetical protein